MNARPAMLFLPGLLCDQALWACQARALADLVRPVIADLTRDDSIAAMAERAGASLSGPFILVGLSMGGYVAFEMLRRMPERILAVALCDTSAAPDTPERAMERRAGIASIALGKFAGVTNRLLTRLVHPDHVDGPIGDAVRAMALRVGSQAYLRQQRAILDRIDSRPYLAGIKAPALVIVGADDRLTPPSEAETIHRGIAGSRFHVIAHCGHLPPMEKPDITSALLRAWLTETVLPRLGG